MKSREHEGYGDTAGTDDNLANPSSVSGSSAGKESACNAGDLGSVPGSGRSPGEGNGNPLQYFCLPWTEEPGGLQFSGPQRVRNDWETNTQTDTHTHLKAAKRQKRLRDEHTQTHTHGATKRHTHMGPCVSLDTHTHLEAMKSRKQLRD